MSADHNSIAALREILETYDWIDGHRLGQRVAQYAWILVQHADDQPEFQAMVLARMEKYLKSGGVRKRDYAFLWDRVAVNHGRKQRFGTQPYWECGAKGLTLRPVEDPESVDLRRAEMGLGPVAADLRQMSLSVCGN